MITVFLVVLGVSLYFLIGFGVYRIDCLMIGRGEVAVLIMWPLYCIFAAFAY